MQLEMVVLVDDAGVQVVHEHRNQLGDAPFAENSMAVNVHNFVRCARIAMMLGGHGVLREDEEKSFPRRALVCECHQMGHF